LFAAGPAGPDCPDLLFIQRSAGQRRHAGQPAFPGGVIDPADAGPVAAALREAAEEVGVDPGGVEVIATLPELFIPPTGFLVVPVLAWWRRPSAVAPVDPAEVAAVERISVSELADPAARLMMHRPRGIILPAFRVRGLLIWGMTAAVVDRLLALAGWERPWDSAAVVDWPELDGGNTTTAGRRIPGELFPARRYRFYRPAPRSVRLLARRACRASSGW